MTAQKKKRPPTANREGAEVTTLPINNTTTSQETLVLGFCDGPATNTDIKQMPVSFDDLVEKLSQASIGPKDGSYLTRCAFTDGKRSNETAGQIHAIVIDGDARLQIDGDGVVSEVKGVYPPALIQEVLKDLDITHAIMPSHSNGEHGPDYYRWRIWVPALLADKFELELSVAWVLHKLSEAGYPLVNVNENNVVAQAWYLPRCRDEATLAAFKVYSHDGLQPFPLDEAKEWAAANPDTLFAEPDFTVCAEPLEKRNDAIAGYLKANNTANALLEALQKRGYEFGYQSGCLDGLPVYRLQSPQSKSGGFGVNVFFSKEKGCWVAFTHHHHDLLADGHAHDLLSVIAKLDHGGNIGEAMVGVGIKRQEQLPKTAYRVLCSIAARIGMDPDELAELIEIDPDAMISIVESTAWHPGQGKFYFMQNGLKISSMTDFGQFANDLFGSYYNTESLQQIAKNLSAHLNQSDSDKFVNGAMGAGNRKLMSIIKVERQFNSMALNVDPFATSESIEVVDNIAKLTFKHRPLTEGPIDDALIADFKKHFPELDDVLDLMVAARFANDRKQAHLWVQATSNWGKSFFLGCLAHHGLVVETSVSELSRVFDGGPVGKTMADFMRSWVLAVDEFKGITREVKQISDSLPFSPKGQPTIRAPLFLKMFMSAEDVPSLANPDTGIEDQFANRFTHLKLDGRLDDREMFTSDKGRYRTSLINYIAVTVNKLVNEYVALGRADAGSCGDAVITEFYDMNRLDKEFVRLDENLEDLVREFTSWVTAAHDRAFAFSEHNVKASRTDEAVYQLVDRDRETGLYYVRSPNKVFDLWLESEFTKNIQPTIRYKQNRMFTLMGGIERRYVNNIRQRYLPLKVSK